MGIYEHCSWATNSKIIYSILMCFIHLQSMIKEQKKSSCSIKTIVNCTSPAMSRLGKGGSISVFIFFLNIHTPVRTIYIVFFSVYFISY